MYIPCQFHSILVFPFEFNENSRMKEEEEGIWKLEQQMRNFYILDTPTTLLLVTYKTHKQVCRINVFLFLVF